MYSIHHPPAAEELRPQHRMLRNTASEGGDRFVFNWCVFIISGTSQTSNTNLSLFDQHRRELIVIFYISPPGH